MARIHPEGESSWRYNTLDIGDEGHRPKRLATGSPVAFDIRIG